MMELSTSEKIRVILKRKGMTLAQLAEATNQSRQNLSQKLERDNFGEQELRLYAEKMGVKFESYFLLDKCALRTFFILCIIVYIYPHARACARTRRRAYDTRIWAYRRICICIIPIYYILYNKENVTK